MAKISTRELKPAEMKQMLPLIAQHNPGLGKALVARRLKAMQALGYRAIGVFDGATLVACSGFWLRTRFWSGYELDIENFFVTPGHRGKKLGTSMLAWFEKFALKEKVDLIVLNTYADSYLAQRFYLQNDFSMTGMHLTKIPGTSTPFVKKKA